MPDAKTYTVTNEAEGPRGFQHTPEGHASHVEVMIDPKGSATADLTEDDVKRLEAHGFKVAAGEAKPAANGGDDEADAEAEEAAKRAADDAAKAEAATDDAALAEANKGGAPIAPGATDKAPAKAAAKK